MCANDHDDTKSKLLMEIACFYSDANHKATQNEHNIVLNKYEMVWKKRNFLNFWVLNYVEIDGWDFLRAHNAE